MSHPYGNAMTGELPKLLLERLDLQDLREFDYEFRIDTHGNLILLSVNDMSSDQIYDAAIKEILRDVQVSESVAQECREELREAAQTRFRVRS